MANRFEVRGLKFYSRSDPLAIDFMCTFSISLRVPSGKYWVAYYKWQGSVSGAIHSHLVQSGTSTLIASGANVLPSFLTADEVMPGEVLEDVSDAKLSYTRSKNSEKVSVHIAVRGSRKLVNIQFNMTEPKPAPAAETLAWEGRVTIWLQNHDRYQDPPKKGQQGQIYKQTLQSSPNAAPPPPYPYFTPFVS